MLYSEKLSQYKINAGEKAISTSTEEIFKLLDSFASEEDIIYVPQKILFSLFDEFCDKKNYQRIPHKATGHAIRKKYNLTRQAVRVEGKVVWVYVKKQEE